MDAFQIDASSRSSWKHIQYVEFLACVHVERHSKHIEKNGFLKEKVYVWTGQKKKPNMIIHHKYPE